MDTNTKIALNDALQQIRDAWNKGYETGTDLANARTMQRYIIATRIKTKRMEKGLSQEKLSEKINANALTYKGYENCKSDIPTVYLVRIANVLDTTVDYLVGRTDEPTPTETAIEERLKKLEAMVYEKSID